MIHKNNILKYIKSLLNKMFEKQDFIKKKTTKSNYWDGYFDCLIEYQNKLWDILRKIGEHGD